MVTREQIEALIHQLNTAENQRPRASVAETIAAIDETMADDVEGWANGRHVPDRQTEHILERALFGLIADYHREIETVIVDPPMAAFTWTMTGTIGRSEIDYKGCSVVEVNDRGKAQRYWYYNDLNQLPVVARFRFGAAYLKERLIAWRGGGG